MFGKALLAGALAVAVLGLLVAWGGNATGALVAYFVVLVLGTGCLAGYRYAEVRRSLSPDHVLEPRWMRRLATAPAALVILSCLANAFVWATEVSKR